jgi:gephyrin
MSNFRSQIHYSFLFLPAVLNLIGETILSKGQLIGPAEVGILATVGVTSVRCYKKPIIGILSTGNELVDFCETPVGSQIRDSNRATLLTAFRQDGYTCIDLGIAHVFTISLIGSSFASLCSSTRIVVVFHTSLVPTIL